MAFAFPKESTFPSGWSYVSSSPSHPLPCHPFHHRVTIRYPSPLARSLHSLSPPFRSFRLNFSPVSLRLPLPHAIHSISTIHPLISTKDTFVALRPCFSTETGSCFFAPLMISGAISCAQNPLYPMTSEASVVFRRWPKVTGSKWGQTLIMLHHTRPLYCSYFPEPIRPLIIEDLHRVQRIDAPSLQ